MRKGQMEIFGLVMIVILMTLGLLFAVIVLTREPRQEVFRVKQSLEAANFLNTMLSTTAPDCNRRSMRELLQDCAQVPVFDGRWTGASLCEDQMTTCERLNESMVQMLERSLGTWGRNYRLFMVGSDAVELVNLSRGRCEGEREGSTRPEVIRPKFTVNVTLWLCQS